MSSGGPQQPEGDEDARSVAASDNGHEDPCQTMVLCSEGQRKDQQTKTAHDVGQHNGLLDTLAMASPAVTFHTEPPIEFGKAERLFRPPSPPFTPPKRA